MPRTKKAYPKIPDREDFDPDEWGNIQLPGITDDELRKTNWNLKPTQAQRLHQSKLMTGRKWTKTHKKKISLSNKKPKKYSKCKFCGTKASNGNLKKYNHNVSLDICRKAIENRKTLVKGVPKSMFEKREQILGSGDQSLWFKISELQFAKLTDNDINDIKNKKYPAPALAKLLKCNKAVIYKVQRDMVDWDRVAKCRKILIKQNKINYIDKIIKATLKKSNKGVWLV